MTAHIRTQAATDLLEQALLARPELEEKMEPFLLRIRDKHGTGFFRQKKTMQYFPVRARPDDFQVHAYFMTVRGQDRVIARVAAIEKKTRIIDKARLPLRLTAYAYLLSQFRPQGLPHEIPPKGFLSFFGQTGGKSADMDTGHGGLYLLENAKIGKIGHAGKIIPQGKYRTFAS